MPLSKDYSLVIYYMKHTENCVHDGGKFILSSSWRYAKMLQLSLGDMFIITKETNPEKSKIPKIFK